MKKRVLSLLLVGLLLCALLPAAVLAEGDNPQPATSPEPTSAHGVSELETVIVPEADKGAGDLFEGFIRQQMGKRSAAAEKQSSGAGDVFTGQKAAVYEAIVAGIHQIAIGQRASASFALTLGDLGSGDPIRMTAEELGVESILEDGSIVQEFCDELRSYMLLIYCALKADCPYDMYWHNVLTGFSYGYDYDISADGAWIDLTYLYFALTVSPDYQDGDNFTVNTTIGQTVVTAGNNARTIVNRYKNVSDYEKLRGYNQEICNLVEYNYDALESGYSFGDPWQLIWAFDGDPSTDIVCEGYSKAFQHLCDLTEFKSNRIHSFIVTGDAGGPHMWNLVRMDDGNTYLVDVTWSDGGWGEMYLLKGYDDGVCPRYKFNGTWRSFDEHTIALYGEEKLTVCDHDYVPAGPVIITQPEDVTVDSWTETTFTVEATGNAITYQWYGQGPQDTDWTLLDGETAATLTLTASWANDGWQYYCQLSDADGTVYTNVVTLTVVFHPPIIKTQPRSVTVDSGEEAVFTVGAVGENLTYMWYGRSPADEEWGMLYDKTEPTMTVLGTIDSNGWRYYCLIQNYDGWVETQEVTLTVRFYPPVITTQPRSVTVDNGEEAVFTVKATGKDVAYQWYGKGPLDADWTELDGETEATLTVVGSVATDGWQYYCHLSNIDGEENTAAATLTVAFHPPVIKTQPQSVGTENGAQAVFTVRATGKNITYQWYGKGPLDADWTELDGETEATLTVVGSVATDGWQYYCRLQNNDGTVDTDVVTLTVVLHPPVIKTQPKDAKAKAGAKAKISVKAAGKNLTYQWFGRSVPTAGWTEIEGATAATYTFEAWMINDGWQYYCRVQNDDGAVDSDVATLTVTPVPASIKTEPKDATVKSGAKAKFSVKAQGPSLQYQWLTRASESEPWEEIPGAVKADWTVVASMAKSGSQYKCRVWNEDDALETRVATLTVTPVPPKFGTHPKDAKVKLGEEAKFKVKASGGTVTYQWYYRTSEDGEWKVMSGETGTILIVVAEEGNIGWQFLCRATNEEGSTDSKIATLKLK